MKRKKPKGIKFTPEKIEEAEIDLDIVEAEIRHTHDRLDDGEIDSDTYGNLMSDLQSDKRRLQAILNPHNQ